MVHRRIAVDLRSVTTTYSIRELSPRTFADFEQLADKQGGCWCMHYQRPRPLGPGSPSGWKATNRRDKRALVRAGHSHAVLVYEGGTAVGWCQYGRADELPRIDAGRGYRKVGRPAGTETLWRITCFFVDRAHRGRGIAKFALRAALASIQRQGGGIVEAYPVVSEKMAAVPEWRWFGTLGMFQEEGFRRVAALGTSGVLVRKTVAPQRASRKAAKHPKVTHSLNRGTA